MSIPDNVLAILDQGLRSIQRQDYSQAIAELEAFCHQVKDQSSPFYLQAQMALVRAHRSKGDPPAAIALCQSLLGHTNPEMNQWAWSMLALLDQGDNNNFEIADSDDDMPSTDFKAGRSDKSRVRVTLPQVADSYIFVVGSALLTPVLIVAAITWGIAVSLGEKDLLSLAEISLGVSLVINGAGVLFSIPVMDWLQTNIYGTQWINLGEIQKYSIETGELLLRLCRRQKMPLPRLGLIDDRRPALFSYGIRRHQTRLVVSKGVFRYLDSEEIATLFAHELGHIFSGDTRLMTVVNAWGQVFYALYVLLQKSRQRLPIFLHPLLMLPATICYGLFALNQACNRYLSRSREYYADHFAVEETGNPNALIRALVKVSKAIVKQERQSPEPALFLDSLRNFGVYDPLTSQTCERATHFNAQVISRLLVWDWLNPWNGLVSWQSSHPLLGKRVQVLSHYAEQLSLDAEYGLVTVRRVARSPKSQQRPRHFWRELAVFSLPISLALLGSAIGSHDSVKGLISWQQGAVGGFGVGLLLKTIVQGFAGESLAAPDVLTLLGEAQLSPVLGTPVHWRGKLKLVQDKTIWGFPKLYFHDRSGVIPVVYPYWLRLIPPFCSPKKALQPFLEHSCEVVGLVRRELTPRLIVKSISAKDLPTLRGYSFLLSGALAGLFLVLAYFLPLFL